MTVPFDYPSTPRVRRHGPAGYADYASFRPWLRDEFAFRCVFCLRREVWGTVVGEFEPVAKLAERSRILTAMNTPEREYDLSEFRWFLLTLLVQEETYGMEENRLNAKALFSNLDLMRNRLLHKEMHKQ